MKCSTVCGEISPGVFLECLSHLRKKIKSFVEQHSLQRDIESSLTLIKEMQGLLLAIKQRENQHVGDKNKPFTI